MPSGTVPPKDINHSDITRPRISGFNLLCTTMDIAVVVKKYANPRMNPKMNAGNGDREIAKNTMLTAKPINPYCTSLR